MIRPLLRALALSACVAASAQAQLGGLIKRAAAKAVEKKTDEKVNELTGGAAPEKKLEGDPVSAPTLDGLLKGLSFEIGQQAEAERIGKLRQAKSDEYSAAKEASNTEAEAYLAKNSNVMDCIGGSLRESNEKLQEQIADRMMNIMNDPNAEAFVKQLTDLSQRVSAAVQKNDTAAVTRLNGQIMRALGQDAAKDSAAAYAKCGKPPAMPASYVKTLKLEKESQNLSEDLRKVELNLFERAAATAGIEKKAYFLARERVWAWNEARKNKKGSGGVTREEVDLFKSRQADILKVEKALR